MNWSTAGVGIAGEGATEPAGADVVDVAPARVAEVEPTTAGTGAPGAGVEGAAALLPDEPHDVSVTTSATPTARTDPAERAR